MKRSSDRNRPFFIYSGLGFSTAQAYWAILPAHWSKSHIRSFEADEV